MSQGWAYRYPLVDFQGNNGSIDGDGPAAYRYTEARLSALSNELLEDIDEDTVKMNLTFDDTLFDPDVLPFFFIPFIEPAGSINNRIRNRREVHGQASHTGCRMCGKDDRRRVRRSHSEENNEKR